MSGDFIPVKTAALLGINTAEDLKEQIESDDFELEPAKACKINDPGCESCQ